MIQRLSMRTIDHYVGLPQNNYLILRFAAALMVILGHSFAITALPGHTDPILRLTRFTFSGAVGVDIFFVISGFLVTSSYLNRRNLPDFIKSRCLRIFPGLFVCLILTAFVLGAVETSLAPGRYFSSYHVYAYVVENFSLIRMNFSLPGVFQQLPITGVNGSLWTLPVEIRMYLLLGLFGASGILFNKRWYLWLLAMLSVLAVAIPFNIPLVYYPDRYARLCLFFAAGSAMSVYRDRIPLNLWILAALVVLVLPFHKSGAFPWLLGPVLAYGVIWFSYVPNLRWFNRFGDYSYGLYIYAFPIQQGLRQHFPDISPMQMFIAASILTLACAMFSWHLVEKHALRLKDIRIRHALRNLVGQRAAA